MDIVGTTLLPLQILQLDRLAPTWLVRVSGAQLTAWCRGWHWTWNHYINFSGQCFLFLSLLLKWNWTMYVCPSSLWSLFLFVDFTDPHNHTHSESLWWKLFKNHKRTGRTQIQRQRQWQRQQQRQRHRESAWKTQHMLHFWNPDDLLIPNMMIDTSPWSSCSCLSPWLGCSGHTFSSTGPSVSPFRDFWKGI